MNKGSKKITVRLGDDLNEQLKDTFTHGGCGILAQEILKLRPDGVPVVWRDREGNATHAAVKLGSRILHFGDRDDGFFPMTVEELNRVVDEEFDPRMGEKKCRKEAKNIAAKIVAELAEYN